MSKLIFDQTGERFFKTGVSKVALYVWGNGTETRGTETDSAWKYETGVAFNGATKVSVNTEDADPNEVYADDKLYLVLRGKGRCTGSLSAIYYPDEFDSCLGIGSVNDGATSNASKIFSCGQQARKPFGLVFKTKIGNDVDGTDHAYKLHIIYGATASSAEDSYETENNSPNAEEMSWDFTTIAPDETYFTFGTGATAQTSDPTAEIVIDSRDYITSAQKTKLAALEDYIYGGTSTDPKLPSPLKVYDLLKAGT